jgi:hypothetical protein
LRYIGGCSNVHPAHLHDAVRAHANTMVHRSVWLMLQE